MNKLLAATATLATVTLLLTGCATEKRDPTAIVDSLTIPEILDKTNTGWYRVTSAKLSQNELGVSLTLKFDITHANGTKFNPVTTIKFGDGKTVVCEADDLRRIPSLVKSTDDWNFACNVTRIPENRSSVVATIVDTYND